MVEETYELFAKLSPEAGMLFYDLTSVLSYSKKLSLAERGYNTDWEQVGQVKVAMAFRLALGFPLLWMFSTGLSRRPKSSSISWRGFRDMDLGFVMDRGFKSYELLLDLKKEHIHYIAALMKNSKLLPASAKMTGAFEYGEKRMIAFCKKIKRPFGFLYLFEDPQIRKDEEEFLLVK